MALDYITVLQAQNNSYGTSELEHFTLSFAHVPRATLRYDYVSSLHSYYASHSYSLVSYN